MKSMKQRRQIELLRRNYERRESEDASSIA
jgi:hypothetical protein